MQEFNEFGARQNGSFETEYAGESPLQEIFAQEAPLEEYGYETSYQEAGYQETPSFEAPYGEVYEAPYQETALLEAPGYEAAAFEVDEYGPTGEFDEGPWNEVLSQEEELALASELMEVQSEEEIDQFLGKLVKRVSRGVRGFARSSAGKMLGGVLKKVARVALPMAGSALGTFIGGPAGTMIGGKLASMAGQAMGLELHEMTAPEADFTAARQFVRLAADTMRRVQAAPRGANPAVVVRQAVQGAARQLAPGLLSRGAAPLRLGPSRSGRRGVWVRRGQTITLYGV